MSRIETTFKQLKAQGRKALIPFITSGDPEPSITVPLMHAMVASGADILELGVPFSDPMADGPTIQRSSERALKFGTGLKDVLDFVVEFRKTNMTTPVVLMGYANPIERMGQAEFAKQAALAGVDGVLTVDYPPEESAEFVTLLHQYGLDPIFLLSPTTPEARFELVAKMARGFLYYVSLKGVTGSANLDLDAVGKKIPEIQAASGLPVGVGFGIRDAATAKAIAAFADAVVIGSRIIQEIEASPKEKLLENVSTLLRDIRTAMDEK
ncbi:tryptophan synthase subunit alpha [Sulfurirhabdus autotrophica]|uniref:Tryptophan synthase alpha chain n=1 Tax=Sulfurirhabdus autotrophica TaxID=1706046 RepID=A0A4R3YEZ3_9PROT|nr:tryptophan synthase subunit alpha [Sulfurirhabdus autotrophica]TCV90472.1 tryptophan synthase alpha chain [Sulfurirhabdus autotrophica]